MKKLLLVTALTFIAQSAFSITNQELTRKILTDNKFIQSVESSIKATFQEPNSIKLKFDSMRAQNTKSPYFNAVFKYWIKAGNVNFGLCSHTIVGAIKPDSSLVFGKIIHEDCGE